jgi:hypothetical protein
MQKTLSLALLAAALFMTAATGTAHHSLGATYDMNREVLLEGRIVQFLFRNPHSFLHVEAADENGELQRWSLEWRGAGALQRDGFGRDALSVGDDVTITMNPSHTRQDHRGVLVTLHRHSDGLGWGNLPGQVVQ